MLFNAYAVMIRIIQESTFRLAELQCIPNGNSVENERFKVSEVLRGIRDLRMWLSALAYFSILVGLYSFGLFVSFGMVESYMWQDFDH